MIPGWVNVEERLDGIVLFAHLMERSSETGSRIFVPCRSPDCEKAHELDVVALVQHREECC